MPCTCPVPAWRPPRGAKNKRLVYSPTQTDPDAERLTVRCNRCLGCLRDAKRELALRCWHEAKTVAGPSWFATFTYDDTHLPADLSVSVDEVQRFAKRIRKNIGPMRYLIAGEYGEPPNRRPHYHALIFGLDLPDLRKSGGTIYGEPKWASAKLEAAWGKGFYDLQQLSLGACKYAAGYIIKKRLGRPHGKDENGEPKRDPRHMRVRFDPTTGEITTWHVRPEFDRRSLKPGIGAEWFNRFRCDVFPSDYLISEGKKVKPPSYYIRKLDEDEQREIAKRRKEKAIANRDEQTDERLMTKHKLAQHQHRADAERRLIKGGAL